MNGLRKPRETILRTDGSEVESTGTTTRATARQQKTNSSSTASSPKATKVLKINRSSASTTSSSPLSAAAAATTTSIVSTTSRLVGSKSFTSALGRTTRAQLVDSKNIQPRTTTIPATPPTIAPRDGVWCASTTPAEKQSRQIQQQIQEHKQDETSGSNNSSLGAKQLQHGQQQQRFRKQFSSKPPPPSPLPPLPRIQHQQHNVAVNKKHQSIRGGNMDRVQTTSFKTGPLPLSATSSPPPPPPSLARPTSSSSPPPLPLQSKVVGSIPLSTALTSPTTTTRPALTATQPFSSSSPSFFSSPPRQPISINTTIINHPPSSSLLSTLTTFPVRSTSLPTLLSPITPSILPNTPNNDLDNSTTPTATTTAVPVSTFTKTPFTTKSHHLYQLALSSHTPVLDSTSSIMEAETEMMPYLQEAFQMVNLLEARVQELELACQSIPLYENERTKLLDWIQDLEGMIEKDDTWIGQVGQVITNVQNVLEETVLMKMNDDEGDEDVVAIVLGLNNSPLQNSEQGKENKVQTRDVEETGCGGSGCGGRFGVISSKRLLSESAPSPSPPVVVVPRKRFHQSCGELNRLNHHQQQPQQQQQQSFNSSEIKYRRAILTCLRYLRSIEKPVSNQNNNNDNSNDDDDDNNNNKSGNTNNSNKAQDQWARMNAWLESAEIATTPSTDEDRHRKRQRQQRSLRDDNDDDEKEDEEDGSSQRTMSPQSTKSRTSQSDSSRRSSSEFSSSDDELNHVNNNNQINGPQQPPENLHIDTTLTTMMDRRDSINTASTIVGSFTPTSSIEMRIPISTPRQQSGGGGDVRTRVVLEPAATIPELIPAILLEHPTPQQQQQQHQQLQGQLANTQETTKDFHSSQIYTACSTSHSSLPYYHSSKKRVRQPTNETTRAILSKSSESMMTDVDGTMMDERVYLKQHIWTLTQSLQKQKEFQKIQELNIQSMQDRFQSFADQLLDNVKDMTVTQAFLNSIVSQGQCRLRHRGGGRGEGRREESHCDRESGRGYEQYTEREQQQQQQLPRQQPRAVSNPVVKMMEPKLKADNSTTSPSLVTLDSSVSTPVMITSAIPPSLPTPENSTTTLPIEATATTTATTKKSIQALNSNSIQNPELLEQVESMSLCVMTMKDLAAKVDQVSSEYRNMPKILTGDNKNEGGMTGLSSTAMAVTTKGQEDLLYSNPRPVPLPSKPTAGGGGQGAVTATTTTTTTTNSRFMKRFFNFLPKGRVST